MRLHDFILNDMESILQAWEDFARTVETPMPVMDATGLRNHGELILRTVAKDMRQYQTDQQQIDKSHGLAHPANDETPAQSHAMTRLLAGFTLDQMVSEYRALRSSVLRLWLAEAVDADHYICDMIRFNESIDQALVESIATYGQAVETTRKTVLGVLGHDLRSPLGAVLMAGDLLRHAKNIEDRERALATQICASVIRATGMINDLLDFARCNLGDGIPINLQVTDLTSVCLSVVEELRTGFPRAEIRFGAGEPVLGLYDAGRMAQVFSNLIGNAIKHGDPTQSISVKLSGDQNRSYFSVHNQGEPIPPHALPLIFNPEGRYSSYALSEEGPSAGLGLGLFIAAEIVKGHGGTISVQSTLKQGTVFSVELPATQSEPAQS
ncbi:sensor histidine kinase KdpD [Pseudomonas sp. FP198]|uniref:sensor histidine kinase n=1 Tax=Pseudomonas sp. FP198 TaxID=2954084 RepID=UPI002735911D|nr:HAMP domain-containing sensor histidine kinase [Pseudomonas sp. FP198]WLG93846.1 HAMP domain-containing sensor histidine kinase [Pseudomonas sp. FP198]